ncbi:uncharacterized protein LOC143590904 [Bidens hawaiensis]|uniref:uncharacterized protein LOC143562625 n=1 Tax=Bidens hawaiensis TaxID=980011 RepID=UPI00404A0DB8
MAAAVIARSVLRSATVRASASRISSGSIKHAGSTNATRSPFSIRTQSHRMFRSPVVEMSSFAMESLLPFHTATASALMTSMLSSTAPCTCAWLIDDS